VTWRWFAEDLHRLYFTALALIAGFFLGLVIKLWWQDRLVDWPTSFNVIKDVLTAIAILVGGWWTIYVLQRRRAHEVKAEILHKYGIWLHGSTRMLRIAVSLRNCGDVRIDPGISYTKIQLVPSAVPESQALAEYTWQEHALIRHEWSDDGATVEPGETETYSHDVALPAEARYVQVATVVKCEKDDPNGPHWDETTLVDLEALNT
jgi:hypothetical protein